MVKVGHSRLVFIAFVIVVTALIIDISTIKISILTTSNSGSTQGVVTFIVIISIILIGQFFLLRFVKSKEITKRKPLRVATINRLVTIVQYILAIILVFIVLQLVMLNQYDVYSLTVAVTISYGMAIVMTGLLAQRFFSWYRLKRNSVVLSYGVSSAIFAAQAGVGILFIDITLLENLPPETVSHLGQNIPYLSPGSMEATLKLTYDILSVLSFMMMWGATSLLLRYFTQKLGRFAYWGILVLPLLFFVSQFLAVYLGLFGPLLQTQALVYGVLLTLIFSLSKLAGGIMFGIAFWIVARNVRRSSVVVKDYMVISAYGLVLLFASSEASVLVSGPYPPFGLATAAFIGLASYLVLVGIYSSAISLAEDSNLRQSIRVIAIRQSKLLDSIGTAEMTQEIEKRVLTIAKRTQATMTNETGIDSSLSEADIKEYLGEVVREVEEKRTKGEDLNM